MLKSLIITVDADVYHGLRSFGGRRRIRRFLSDLVRRHVIGQHHAAGYAAMAADEVREADVEYWVEGVIGHIANEPSRRAG